MNMFFDLIGNPVLISVAILLFLSVIRLNVVFALILASLIGGLVAGLDCSETMKVFLGSGLAFQKIQVSKFARLLWLMTSWISS